MILEELKNSLNNIKIKDIYFTVSLSSSSDLVEIRSTYYKLQSLKPPKRWLTSISKNEVMIMTPELLYDYIFSAVAGLIGLDKAYAEFSVKGTKIYNFQIVNRCECGTKSAPGQNHSTWCPIYKREF